MLSSKSGRWQHLQKSISANLTPEAAISIVSEGKIDEIQVVDIDNGEVHNQEAVLSEDGKDNVNDQEKYNLSFSEIAQRYEDEKKKRNKTDLTELRLVADEYQALMEHVYNDKIAALSSDRRHLIHERFDVIDRLETLRNSLIGDELGHPPDESIEESYAMAEMMPQQATQAIAGYHDRILFVGKEINWLERGPPTDLWKGMKDRYQRNIVESNAAVDPKKLAGRFFQSLEEREHVLRDLRNYEASDNVAKSVARAIIMEAIAEIATSVVNEMLKLFRMLKAELETVALKSVAGLMKPNKGVASIISGQSRIFIGALEDLCAVTYDDHAFHKPSLSSSNISSAGSPSVTSYKLQSTQIVKKSGFIFSPTSSILQPHSKKVTSTISWFADFQLLAKQNARECSHCDVDKLRFEALNLWEINHWIGAQVLGPATAHHAYINLPKEFGKVTVLKFAQLSRGEELASYCFAGSHQGNLGIWRVPWADKAATFLAMSPTLPRNEKARLIDIKVSSTMILDNIVAMAENGHIRIYSMISATTQQKSFWDFSSFLSSSQKTPVTLLSCLYHIAPQMMNLPDQMQHSIWNEFLDSLRGSNNNNNNINNNKQPAAKSAIVLQAKDNATPQPRMVPCTVCFHPSLTLLGRNTSIMIGAEGGDIFKFNIDFAVSNLQSPVTFLPPFVGMEYVIPGTFHEDIIIAAANKSVRGNKVLRELFHFHKSKIIFMSAVGAFSSTIVSLDSSCLLAIWKYDKSLFEGNCWFIPEYSARLDFQVRLFKPLTGSDIVFYEDLFANETELRQHLFRRKRYRTKDGNISEVFYPCIHEKDFVEFRCIYSEEDYADAVAYQELMTRIKLNKEAKHAKDLKDRFNNINYEVDDKDDDENDLLLQQQQHLDRFKNHHDIAGKAGMDAVQEDIYSHPGTVWLKRVIEEVRIDPNIIAHQISSDGYEIYFMVSFLAPANYHQEMDESSDNTGTNSNFIRKDGRANFVAILTYDVLNRFFRPVYPKFMIHPSEKLWGLSVGPVISETLTRHAFVHINMSVRVFSLTTGCEVSTASLPISIQPWPVIVKGQSPRNPPMVSGLCTSQRILAFASPDDAMFSIYRLQHVNDGKSNASSSFTSISSKIAEGLPSSIESLKAIAVPSVLPSTTSKARANNNNPSQDDIPDDPLVVKEIAFSILDEVILPAVYATLEEQHEKRLRVKRIEELYGQTTGLGVVHPVDWTYETIPPIDPEEKAVFVVGHLPAASQQILIDNIEVRGDNSARGSVGDKSHGDESGDENEDPAVDPLQVPVPVPVPLSVSEAVLQLIPGESQLTVTSSDSRAGSDNASDDQGNSSQNISSPP